jgi:hypothetical protein
MRTGWMSGISLVLSAITLAVVLSVAVRPAPAQSVDARPALESLRAGVVQMRADIAALRTIAERPVPAANTEQLTAIQAKLDSLSGVVGEIATKFTALCNAVNSSPFSPPGGAC